nr:DnaD domain protein [Apilactobacillus ozensis]
MEQEFGRSLSPIELETISQWMDSDNYSFEMILLALKESVLNQVRSLKYMDRILLNWEKSNIRTPYEVEVNRKQRYKGNYQGNSNKNHTEKGPEIPIFKLD